MTFQLNTNDMLSILPFTLVFAVGMLVLLLETLRKGKSMKMLAWVSLGGVVLACVANRQLLGQGLRGFGGSVVADDYAVVFNIIFLAVAFFTILISMRYLEDRGIQDGEYYALVLFATGGMMVMASSLDLLMIFVGLEILSISSYILTGMLRRDHKSNEAAMKYFLLGAFATGFLLYGMVMLYGATGTINLREIGTHLAVTNLGQNPYIWFGMGLLIVGFGFKLSLVPFHMWTPDVYEGAPTTVTAFMSAGPKAAGFAALVRVMVEGLGNLHDHWWLVMWILAALTMTLGNVVAIWQDNIKRMLAYSSIAHAGYILAALVVANIEGLSAIVFYGLVYTLGNMGVFAILVLASDKNRERVTFEDYRGFGYVSPLLGMAMLVFMLSLIGIPLTGGFVGKFQIFKAAVEQGYLWLAVVGVINSVISVYYYLRLVVVMYMQPPTGASLQVRPPFNLALTVAIAASLAGVVYLGILPSGWLDMSSRSVSVLMAGF